MKTIAIISQKGGAGKTTIAIHLAVASGRLNMKAALFDLDPQASASSWSDKRQSPSPAVVSAQAARLPGLLEQAAAQSADLVIIDSALNADAASLAAARAADLILIPCRPAAFDLNAIGTTLNFADAAGKPAYVVFNAVPPRSAIGEAYRRYPPAHHLSRRLARPPLARTFRFIGGYRQRRGAAGSGDPRHAGLYRLPGRGGRQAPPGRLPG